MKGGVIECFGGRKNYRIEGNINLWLCGSIMACLLRLLNFTLCVARIGLYAVKVNCFRVTMALLLVFFLFLAFIQERLQEVCS